MNTDQGAEMITAPSFITEIARKRADAIQEGDGPSYPKMYARRDALRVQLETRGTSAVALEELRLLEEDCMALDHEWEMQAKAEMDAENAWLRYAEMPTADDYAFEAWEAERCSFDPQGGYAS